MKAQLILGATIGLATSVILTGCATMSTLPTYDDVRSETFAAMQKVADQMPAGSRLEDLTDPTPFTCGPSSHGVFFTGHWFVHGPENSDTRTIIADLPAMVGDDFAVQPPGVKVDYPAVLLISRAGGVRLDVSDIKPDSDPGIDILATSRCAQEPASPSP